MKRRILLVDDDVAVLLTLKAVLEISGFDVDTAASGRDGKSKLRSNEYHMIISDMRMESEASGAEVIAAARAASYHPAVALLTAYPIADEDWQTLGADKMLVKPMHTRVLLEQIERLLTSHENKLRIWSSLPPITSGATSAPAARKAAKQTSKATKPPSKPSKVAARKPAAKRTGSSKTKAAAKSAKKR